MMVERERAAAENTRREMSEDAVVERDEANPPPPGVDGGWYDNFLPSIQDFLLFFICQGGSRRLP